MPVIKIRRGTTQQWAASNRVLQLGELGLDTTLNKLKAGNGSTAWSSLAFLQADADVTELAQDAVATALANGTHSNITVTYSDNGNSISLATGADVVTTTSLSNTLTNATTGYVPIGDVGSADGVASLDANGKVPDSEIPTAIARLASPTFTGTPTLPTGTIATTQTAGNNSTALATTAFVGTAVSNLVNAAPESLNTLKELSDALGSDANYASTITTALGTKAPIASPTFTGTVGGITKSMVGLANVDNTTDALKPVSTATQTALDLKANLASPTLTGTPAAPTATTGTNTTQIATTAFVKTEISNSVQPGAVYQTSAPSSPAVGQIWIDSDEDVTTFDSNIIRRKAITATAGQTVFTADLPFIDGFEQIFMNGLLLVKTTDYATSGGNTVTLTSAAAASDIIEIVSVTGANSVNTYTQAEVNALLAANTSVAPLSISANTTLVAKKRYFVTSASALTLTLPASPALNDEIQIVDASGNASTYNITVARNANKINGGTNNLIIDTNGGWYTLLYTGATYGWKVG